MSVLVHSHDLYLSTQQSGTVGPAQSTFDNFKVCLNSQPLRCKTGEVLRLSLTQFSCYRNFYHINKFNNLILVEYRYNGVGASQILKLDEGDYDTIEDIADNLGVQLTTMFASIVTAVNNTNRGTSKTQRTLDLELNTASNNNISYLLIRCPQYYDANDETTFNDSYCILGGKRIADYSIDDGAYSKVVQSRMNDEGFLEATFCGYDSYSDTFNAVTRVA